MYDKQATYICAIFLHWMGHLVTLVSSTLPRKKAFLAHVKVEAFETSVSRGEGLNILKIIQILCYVKVFT